MSGEVSPKLGSPMTPVEPALRRSLAACSDDIAAQVEAHVASAMETAMEKLESLIQEKSTSAVEALRRTSQEPKDQWEAAIAKERLDSQERLASSCSQLTGHLNELREELLEQRETVERLGRQPDFFLKFRQEVQQDIESRVSRLGGTLATRLEAKVLSQVQTAYGGSSDVLWRQEIAAAITAARDRAIAAERAAVWADSQVELLRHEAAEFRSRSLTNGPTAAASDEVMQVLTHLRKESRVMAQQVSGLESRQATLEAKLGSRDGTS